MARGSVTAYYFDGSNTSPIKTSVAFASGAAVSVDIDDSAIAYVLVYGTSVTTDSVGKVTITGHTGITQDVWVYVARAPKDDTLFYPDLSTAAGHNLLGLDDQRTQGKTLIKIHMQGDLVDDIDAQDLVTLQINASVLAGVKSHGAHFATDHFRVQAGRASRYYSGTSTPHPGFEQVHHDISYIQTNNPTNPELDCPISVPDGSLKQLIVAGYLGQLPVLGNGKYNPITVSGFIDILSAYGVRAEITATGGVGVINVSPSGMKGSLTTPTLVDSSSAAGSIVMDTGFKPETVLSSGLRSDSSIIVKRWWGDDTGATVKFRFAGTNRLAGQIIINADNQASAMSEPGKWYDQIRVANPADPTNESVDFLLLGQDQGGNGAYSYSSSQLGGGAVGLVPFWRYRADCDPPDTGTPPVFFQSELNHYTNANDEMTPQRPILLRWYGPVKTDGTGSPVRIIHVINDGVISDELNVDATARFTVTVNPGGTASERTVKIEGKASTFYFPGLYSIEPVTTGANKLYCDVPSKPAVHDAPDGADSESDDDPYYFVIAWDCNGNRVADVDDIALDGNLDMNHDGLIDDCDRYGGCIADFDENGFVNGDDADWFELFMFWGASGADIDANGFVNGDDGDIFAAAFYNGC